jgi:prepilin-type N-terminal cleavage/methylation domain-containing protein
MPHAEPRTTSGFTLIELILVVAILGTLAAIALPAYVSMSRQAESASVEYMTGTLSSALNVNAAKLLASGQPIAAHNPFDDLIRHPDNYAGAFGDVDLTNCQPGQWAYQTGNAANGYWPVLIYRPKVTMAAAFGWGGVQWIIYTVTAVTNAQGATVGLALIEYPPAHQW